MKEQNQYLVVIDLQKSFNRPAYKYQHCLDYIRTHQQDYSKIFATVFKQRTDVNPNYRDNLNWHGCMNIDQQEELEYVKDIALEKLDIVCKHGYGCETLISNLRDMIQCDNLSKDVRIDIIGCDLDACVFAICFQLWDAGFTNWRLLTDYCYESGSFSSKCDRSQLIAMMKNNFGKCIV